MTTDDFIASRSELALADSSFYARDYERVWRDYIISIEEPHSPPSIGTQQLLGTFTLQQC